MSKFHDRNRYIMFMETEIRSHEIVDELCRFVEFHAADVIAHTVQARALVAYHGPASAFGCLGQCCFELLYFFIGHTRPYPPQQRRLMFWEI